MYNFLNTIQRTNRNRPQRPRQNSSMSPQFILSNGIRNRRTSQMRMILPHVSSIPVSPSSSIAPPSTPPPPSSPLSIMPDPMFSFDFNNPIFSFNLEESNIDVLEMMYRMEQDILRESKIYANTIPIKYKNKKNEIKNDICPILQTAFEEDTIVSWFVPCHHAIDSSTFERFVVHFSKCPLCNTPLAV